VAFSTENLLESRPETILCESGGPSSFAPIIWGKKLTKNSPEMAQIGRKLPVLFSFLENKQRKALFLGV
jgi:hypothetical protein